jgi:hypothetical protein
MGLHAEHARAYKCMRTQTNVCRGIQKPISPLVDAFTFEYKCMQRRQMYACVNKTRKTFRGDVSERIQVRSNSSPYTFAWLISSLTPSFLFHVGGKQRSRNRSSGCTSSLISRGQSLSFRAPVSPFGNVNFLVTASSFSSQRQLFRRVE